MSSLLNILICDIFIFTAQRLHARWQEESPDDIGGEDIYVKRKNPLVMWGIALETEAAAFLEQAACSGCVLHNWDGRMPDNSALESDEPVLVWVSQRGWRS